MRKLVFIVIAACMAMISAACYHSTNSTNTAADSTEVVVDSVMDSVAIDGAVVDSTVVDGGVVVE